MGENNKYFYRVYGINISSEIKVEEFDYYKLNNHLKIDVEINKGMVKEEIKKEIKKGITNNFSFEEIWFYIKDVATYYIQGGKNVIVEPAEKAEPYNINLYLWGSVMGFILLQRKKLAIHGSAIAINDLGIIITGDRGAGKSTLTTAFLDKGYKFLCDDVASLNFEDNITINPGFPYSKLCEDTLVNLGLNKNLYKPIIGDNKVKYFIYNEEKFYPKKVPLRFIFEIEEGDVEKVIIKEVNGEKKIEKIRNNIFRGEFISVMGGFSTEYNEKILKLASKISFFAIKRPKNTYTLKEQINVIYEVVNK